MAQQAAQKGAEQIFEAKIVTEDARLHEQGTGRKGLEGLDEAVRSAEL
jgi:hypothetical protein